MNTDLFKKLPKDGQSVWDCDKAQLEKLEKALHLIR